MQKKPLLLLMGFLLCSCQASIVNAAAMQQEKLLDKIKGVYTVGFTNELIDGSKLQVENKLQIIPVNENAFYFSIYLNFYNNHTCSLQGIAKFKEDSSFVFVDTANNTPTQKCYLRFTVTNKGITTFDVTNQCRNLYCGANSGFNDNQFTFAKRAPIKNLSKINSVRQLSAGAKTVPKRSKKMSFLIFSKKLIN